MRKFATFNLFYLAFVAASALSSVHVDHEGSHEKLCVGVDISAACHADLPHEHEATHAGQESLFEHTFENGNFESSCTLPALNFVAVAGIVIARPVLFLPAIQYGEDFSPDTNLSSQTKYSAQSSRAPPAA